jgi:hypothetical protein
MPQLFASDVMSTHIPLQFVSAVAQQIPAVQCDVIAVHALPHMPQLASSFWRSTHAFPHWVIVQTPVSLPVSAVIDESVPDASIEELPSEPPPPSIGVVLSDEQAERKPSVTADAKNQRFMSRV